MPILLCLAVLLAVVLGCQQRASSPHLEKQVVRIRKAGMVIDCGGKDFAQGRITEIQVFADDVKIRNCVITGSVRTIGLGRVGESEDLRRSSYSQGHTRRAQAQAPKNLRVDRVRFNLVGLPGVYLGPGTTSASVTRSILAGQSNSFVIYLDAESAHNRIVGNTFRVQSQREQIAVDGSAYNIIQDNVFHAVRRGGIHLYRNCGEGGTIRHQSPSYNRIINNKFPNSENGRLVVVNSRSGNRRYCAQDKGYPYGSSADDRDRGVGNDLSGNEDPTRPPSRHDIINKS
ncbi:MULTISPECIES: hypothetical protein [Aphanothece]|uniref:hypothetical protein n=1 Tax=Aphanothece TaxID=1121 RepID=UPI00398E410F